MTEGDDDYMLICDAARTAQDVPHGLLFWLLHQRYCIGEWVWNECPRGDWLLWIAERLGYPQEYLHTLRTEMTEAMLQVRSHAHTYGALIVRGRIDWMRLQRNRLAA